MLKAFFFRFNTFSETYNFSIEYLLKFLYTANYPQIQDMQLQIIVIALLAAKASIVSAALIIDER